MRKCVFCKIKDTKSGDVSFFKFPADKKILQLWIQNMSYKPNWKSSKYHFLCSRHFSTQCIDFRDQLFRLRKGSIPTIFHNNKKTAVSDINYRQILDNQIDKQQIADPQAKNTVTSTHIIDHDHSYTETPEKLKNNLMIAKAKIRQLTAKNHILVKKDKRSKKKMASMKQIIKDLREKTLPKDSSYTLNGLKDIPAVLYSRIHKNIQLDKIYKRQVST